MPSYMGDENLGEEARQQIEWLKQGLIADLTVTGGPGQGCYAN